MRSKHLRILAVVCILAAVALLVAACGEKETTTTAAPSTTAGPSTTSGPTTTAAPSTETSTATTLGGKDKIVIGAARPISGPLSFFEQNALGVIYKMWVEEVNAEGGIYVAEYGKKLPIEMKVYDDQSDMDTCMRLLEKLMVEDKVDFILSPASTAFVFAAANVANSHGYLLISGEAGAKSIEEVLPDLPMFFGLLSYSNHYDIPTLIDIFKEVGVKSVAMVYLDDLHGLEYSEVMRQEAKNAGIKLLYDEAIPANTADFTQILRKVQQADPDCFFVPCYPDQNFPMVAQMMQLGYNPRMLVMGPGATFGAFPFAMGGDKGPEQGYKVVEGVCGYGVWSVHSSPALAQLHDKLLQRVGTEANMNYYGYAYFVAALDMLKQAIEKAGTLDNKKVAEVLKTEHFQTVLGDTWFENQLLARDCYAGFIGQWQNGVIEVIDPGPKRTAKPIYPKPPWPGQ
ncbi:MAG: amino acid ABC transporter substrate-binding protein [Thermoleophilia bacterium]|nr:amino acid ABC transporter substrate-binding protein [Thermoleophilia bacterium]